MLLDSNLHLQNFKNWLKRGGRAISFAGKKFVHGIGADASLFYQTVMRPFKSDEFFNDGFANHGSGPPTVVTSVNHDLKLDSFAAEPAGSVNRIHCRHETDDFFVRVQGQIGIAFNHAYIVSDTIA